MLEFYRKHAKKACKLIFFFLIFEYIFQFSVEKLYFVFAFLDLHVNQIQLSFRYHKSF